MSTQLALIHSANCFLNSYLRDSETPYLKSENAFHIEVEGITLILKPTYYSQMGVHQFQNDFILKTSHGERQIGFLEIAELLCRDSGSLLFDRLNNSLQNIAFSIESRQKEIEALYSEKLNFLKAEQGLHIGHNFHPTPKSRDEFSKEDFVQYGPEFGGNFKLKWFLVHSSLIWEEKSESFTKNNWLVNLYKREIPKGFTPFPVHPWQKEILKQDPLIKNYIQEKMIFEGEENPERWFATSSMRSVYSPTNSYMLKFSMSVRMTNSVRHMQEDEVKRGMILRDVLHTEKGQEFSSLYPYFQIMHEPVVMAIKDTEGKVLPQTVVLVRENTLKDNPESESAVLATLTQDNPLTGKNLIASFLSEKITGSKWFEAFVKKAINPLILAQADYGIMLGAHQQNLIIHFENGLPSGSTFRDCQGIAFSGLGEALFLKSLTRKYKLLENVLPTEVSTTLFTYYLIINSVMNTIAAVAKASDTPENVFTDIFVKELLNLKPRVKDPSVINHLLNSKTLDQKGNFRCSSQNLNENTTKNPLSIYNSFPNPFYREIP